MRRASEVRRCDREASHGRRPHRRRRRAPDHRVQRDQPDRGPDRVAPQQRIQRALHDAGEDRDLETAEDEEVDKPGRDQRVLQLRGNAAADAEHDPEKHRGVRCGQRIVKRRDVPPAQPPGQAQDAALAARDLEARRLHFEVHVMLRQVGPPVERRQVARQRELSGRHDSIPIRGISGPAPANHQVAYAGDLRCGGLHLGRFDQDL